MKKLIIAAIALIAFNAAASAQTTTPVKKPAAQKVHVARHHDMKQDSSRVIAMHKATVKTEAKAPKDETAAKVEKKTHGKKAKVTAKKHIKKDGSPDKRYKENEKQ